MYAIRKQTIYQSKESKLFIKKNTVKKANYLSKNIASKLFKYFTS